MVLERTLAQRIQVVEEGYEFLLEYARQGREQESGTPLRDMLAAMESALDGLGELIRERVDWPAASAGLLRAIERDADVARGAIALVLARDSISSLLVENLHASIHLRALVTDLFLVDQAGQPPARR